jgi:hypothetical protein
MLYDTLSLVQLARESALVQGKKAEAQKLSPVVDNLRTLVASNRETTTNPVPATGMMAQGDFKVLLDAANTSTPGQHPVTSVSQSERHLMVNAMAAGNMSNVDIARQMGMSQEEVALILSVNQKGKIGG